MRNIEITLGHRSDELNDFEYAPHIGNYGNSSISLGRGGHPPLLEILVIKGFFGILAVIKHFEQFAEGEKKLGKFRRRRKKIGGIFTG